MAIHDINNLFQFIYIDIETCYKFELTESGQEYITMIGIYYNSRTTQDPSSIKQFTITGAGLTKDNETELINRVDQFLKELNEQKEIVIVHYTEAEQKVFKRFSEKYTTEEQMEQYIKIFSSNTFDGGRHQVRLQKIKN
jgi:NADH dehydrogenase FAD-containing subunit